MKALFLSRLSLVSCLALCLSNVVFAQVIQSSASTLQLKKGAVTFIGNCTLCHGKHGMGEGVLSLKLHYYPNTNIVNGQKATTLSDIKKTIRNGSQRTNINMFMPPWKHELSEEEINNAAYFIQLLKTDTQSALQYIDAIEPSSHEGIGEGKDLFQTRCVLCHGNNADGNGRMAKIINSPAPADLRNLQRDDSYLLKIISLGGESMGRSAQMPPWGEELSQYQINSIILYLRSLADKKTLTEEAL
ncbi:c-type cytochrome [Psychromonas sp. Urea-02u-13]|uniref:c-type cytochrome n=1 Tax=Psychromonas sp. Urea-02u-13 TaxID=2058326 RepID=UPI000C32F379|nr:c-type cytochrome [Psychromonas sp. Urea-02u-13]PKG37443.1 cytochrome c [Psychromonas sp. Urea-02u-13]